MNINLIINNSQVYYFNTREIYKRSDQNSVVAKNLGFPVGYFEQQPFYGCFYGLENVSNLNS